MDASGDITRLLTNAQNGERGALDELLPYVYGELRVMARRELNRRRDGQTLNTTALVHEAYLKLSDQPDPSWENRRHFFGVAAKAMRHLLVDHARRRKAGKRGGGQQPLSLDDTVIAVEDRAEELLALDEALDHLATLDERCAQTVELRFFGGLSAEETAAVLDISERTVKRDWRRARAYLYRIIHDEPAS